MGQYFSRDTTIQLIFLQLKLMYVWGIAILKKIDVTQLLSRRLNGGYHLTAIELIYQISKEMENCYINVEHVQCKKEENTILLCLILHGTYLGALAGMHTHAAVGLVY